MFYHEDALRFRRFLFCLFFLAASSSVCFASQDVIDLGEEGFSCPLTLRVNEKSLSVINEEANVIADSR